MTDIGYQEIIDRIEGQIVFPPTDLTLLELNSWMIGYAAGHQDAINCIESLKEGKNQLG